MNFDRRSIEPKLALRRISPDEMPALAWDALEAGLDGKAIRRLAALVNPSGWEVDQIIPAFMSEAGLEVIPKGEAAIRIARHIARRILLEGSDPVAHTRAFWLLYVEADYPSEIQEVGLLDDEKFVAEYKGGTENEFREYARKVLVDLVGGEEQIVCDGSS